MKIGVFALSEIFLAKLNVKDVRLDSVDAITRAKKKTYVQVELVGEDALRDADVIIARKGSLADLILGDLEFVETRLGRAENAGEKDLLVKLKGILEKEQCIFSASLNDAEKFAMSGYGVLTVKPIIAVEDAEIEEVNSILLRALKEGGFISFFTTGEKETRAWLIKKGMTAWEAAGVIHSDIQRGFIRAEIIACDDFLAAGGESQAKQAGKMRLEQKEYVMQDCDLANFRFNK